MTIRPKQPAPPTEETPPPRRKKRPERRKPRYKGILWHR
ncbi:hypothetical protein SAMN04488539_0304 [Corynebacterium timonense]|uniref:Uncharacterized protein n=1 Tax=Corynebacterium timonense TaxID=441500 RepID=A0A1H1LQL3_9CORY|nr:hypothetical protein SAMN04488539_0304 [Corynebacterium timonense]